MTQKFALFIKQISLVLNNKQVVLPSKGYSTEIGILLAIGAFMTFYAYWRYCITEKQLLDKAYKPTNVTSLILTLAILILGFCW